MFDKSQNQTAATEEASNNKKVVSITEAARINNVSRQAIYVAIKSGGLRAHKGKEAAKGKYATRWAIELKDLEEYRKNKYSRKKSMYNGELLFDNEKGFFSVNQVAEMLGVPAQQIYYATRVGLLKAIRKGAAWVVHINDVKAYQENYLSKRSKLPQTA